MMSKKKSNKNDWTKLDDKLSQEISKRRLERVRSLVGKDRVLPTKLHPITGSTALHQAAFEGDIAVLNIFIDCKQVDLNSRDLHGRTVLHRAAAGDVFATERLLQCQPPLDVSDVDHNGLTVLHHACIGNHLDCVKLLLEHHAPVFVKDKNGRSALSYAAERGQASICRLLLQHGADIDDKDNFNRTALMLAAEAGYPAVCDYLIRQGADTNITNAKGSAGVDRSKMYMELSVAGPEREGATEATPIGLEYLLRGCFAGWDALYIATKGNKTEVAKILERASRDPPPSDNTEQRPQIVTHKTGENEYEEMPNADEVALMVSRAAAAGSLASGTESEQKRVAVRASPSSASSTAAAAAGDTQYDGKASKTSIRSRERLPTPDIDAEDDLGLHTYHSLGGTFDDQILMEKIAKFEKLSDGVSVSLSMTDVGSPVGKVDIEDRDAMDGRAASATQQEADVAYGMDDSDARSAAPLPTSKRVDQRTKQSHRVSTASETSLTLRQVDIDDKDVELLPQIINELEAENATMNSELERIRGEKKDLELSQLELEKKYTLVVNSHQWLLQELCQILKLVESFRHELAASAPMIAETEASLSGQNQLRNNAADDVVDTGLEQIERLIGALVHLDHDVHYIEDVDVYGCYEADVDKLVSMSKRLQRSNQTLQYELRQSVHENMALHRQVEELEKIADAACRLQEESDALRIEYDQLVGDIGNFNDHVMKIAHMDKEEPVEFMELARFFESRVEENEELRRAVKELLARVDELESAAETGRQSVTDTDEKEELAIRYRQFSIQLDALQQANMSKEDENKQLTDSTIELTGKIASLENEVRNLRGLTAEMENNLMEAVDENKRLVVAKQQLTKALSQFQSNVNSSTAGMEAVITELSVKNDQLVKANEELEVKLNALERIKLKSESSEDLSKELDILRFEKKRLEDEVERMNEAVSRQSQMILNMDEELRERRASDAKQVVHQTAVGQASEQRVQQTPVFHVSSSCQTSLDGVPGNGELRVIGETPPPREAKEKLENELDSARRQLQQFTLSIEQYEEALIRKTVEIDRLQSEIVERKKQTKSEKDYFQRKIDSLHKEHSALCQKLSEENETLRNELISKNRSIEESSAAAPTTFGSIRDGEYLVERRKQRISQNSSKSGATVTGSTVGQIAKLFAEGCVPDRQESDEALQSGSLNSGAAADGNEVDGNGADLESDEAEWCEQKLLSDLAKAVDASQVLLNENRRLRHEIDKLVKLKKQSQSEDSTSMTDTHPVELENGQLRNYIKELESEVSNLKRTIKEQGMHLEDASPRHSYSDLVEQGDGCEQGLRLERATEQPQSTSHYTGNVEMHIMRDENDHKSIVGRKYPGSSSSSASLKPKENKNLDGGMSGSEAMITTMNLASLQVNNNDPKRADDDSDSIPGAMEIHVDSDGRKFNEVLDENLRLREDVQRLTSDLNSSIREVMSKQAVIHGLESFLTKNKESTEKLEHAKNGALDYVSRFESIAEKAEELLSTCRRFNRKSWRDNSVVTKDTTAIRNLQHLLETFKQIDNERNDLLGNVASLQDLRAQQESVASLEIGKFHARLQELEQELSQCRRELGKADKSSDLSETKTSDNADSTPEGVDDSRRKDDVIAALKSENEALSRLLESRAPQLAPDFEERLLAEIESLSSECQSLRQRLSSGSKSQEDRTANVSYPAEEAEKEELNVVDLKSEIDRLRDENRFLRFAISSDDSTRTIRPANELVKDSVSVDDERTMEIGGDRRPTNEAVNGGGGVDSISESNTSMISPNSDGKRGVVQPVGTPGPGHPVTTEVNRPSATRLPLTPSLAAESDVNSDRRQGRSVDGDLSDLDVVQLRRRCRQIEVENEALRDKMATAWKVSVQHAVSRNVSVQTTGGDYVTQRPIEKTRRGTEDDDEDIYLTYCSVTSIPKSATPSPMISGPNLDTDQLLIEIRRLTRTLAGRIDPLVKEVLLQIVQSRHSDKLVSA